MELRRARSMMLSAGLALWGAGAATSVTIVAGSASANLGNTILTIAVGAITLAALVVSVGMPWEAMSGRWRRPPDPMAEAWLLLTMYPVIAAMPVLFAAHDAGIITADGRNLGMGIALAGMLFLRALVLLSPTADRVLAVDAHRSVPPATARWLAPAAAAAYATAGSLAFAAAVAGAFWLAAAGVVVGFAVSQIGLIAVARSAGQDQPDARPRELSGRTTA